MTKKQLIERAAKESGLTKKSLTEAYEALMQATEHTLQEGESIQISGFGIFDVKQQEARIRRNPKTNEPVEIPASRRLTFSVSKTMKEKLNP